MMHKQDMRKGLGNDSLQASGVVLVGVEERTSASLDLTIREIPMTKKGPNWPERWMLCT